jgi:hypothetical protein
MRNFVGLPSASVLFEGLLSASVHFDLSWWLIDAIHWNQHGLVLAFAIDF